MRERRTEQRIFEELRLEGYAGSVDQVRRYYGTLRAVIAPRRCLSRRASLPVRRISISAQARRVDSWTTLDVNIGYRVEGGAGWLANTQCNLGINNALDQRPPFVNRYYQDSGTLGYDPANASLLGRQISLLVAKQWGALSARRVKPTVVRCPSSDDDRRPS